MDAQPQSVNELRTFLDFLYGGIEGIAYVATKDPTNPLKWGQHFFNVPAELDRLESVILTKTSDVEVYLSPALYSEPNPVKENFKVSNVVWTEFDGNAPSTGTYDYEPSVILQSSGPDNQHVYWRLSDPIFNANALEEVNRRITYAHAADSSAWDATQVLRPPGTLNHKRGNAQVAVVRNTNVEYDISVFDSLPQAPAPVDDAAWQLGSLPHVEDVILKYPFPPDLILLLQKSKEQVSDGSGQRAKSLVSLAYGCAEMGMGDAEIFVVLRLADDRWEKFKHRKDRNKRLSHIITVARHKYPAELYGPDAGEQEDEPFTFAFDFVSFLNTEIEIDWIIEPMLMEQGSMLLVGPSGIGKTQWTLNLLIHVALGKNYMHYKVKRPRKVMFVSLEMDHGSLKKFLEQMAKTLDPADFMLLQENFIVVPHGEPWALNLPVGQEYMTRMIEDYQPEIIAIDSIGSSIKGSLSKDEDVQELINYNDRIRKKYGCSLWYIHHMRKTANGGHAPTSQDDIYGNQYLLNRSTSSYGVLRGRDGLIKIRNFKNRLAPQEQDFYIKRKENLTFEEAKGIVEQTKILEYHKPEDEKGPTAGGGKFSL